MNKFERDPAEFSYCEKLKLLNKPRYQQKNSKTLKRIKFPSQISNTIIYSVLNQLIIDFIKEKEKQKYA